MLVVLVIAVSVVAASAAAPGTLVVALRATAVSVRLTPVLIVGVAVAVVAVTVVSVTLAGVPDGPRMPTAKAIHPAFGLPLHVSAPGVSLVAPVTVWAETDPRQFVDAAPVVDELSNS